MLQSYLSLKRSVSVERRKSIHRCRYSGSLSRTRRLVFSNYSLLTSFRNEVVLIDLSFKYAWMSEFRILLSLLLLPRPKCRKWTFVFYIYFNSFIFTFIFISIRYLQSLFPLPQNQKLLDHIDHSYFKSCLVETVFEQLTFFFTQSCVIEYIEKCICNVL